MRALACGHCYCGFWAFLNLNNNAGGACSSGGRPSALNDAGRASSFSRYKVNCAKHVRQIGMFTEPLLTNPSLIQQTRLVPACPSAPSIIYLECAILSGVKQVITALSALQDLHNWNVCKTWDETRLNYWAKWLTQACHRVMCVSVCWTDPADPFSLFITNLTGIDELYQQLI